MTTRSVFSADTVGFGATHWSLVLRACQTQEGQSTEALEQLCGRYWHPIYHYIRRRGYSVEDSKDLTQAFFAQFLEKDRLRRADQARGQFRCFLLSCLRNFLNDAHDHAAAKKRGGHVTHVPLEWAQAEQQLSTQLSEADSSDKIFDRSWALSVLRSTRDSLRQHYEGAEKGDRFDVLVRYLTGNSDQPSYAETASELQMSETAVKTEVKRMRARFRALLRAEVGKTVSAPEEIDEEIRYLVRIV